MIRTALAISTSLLTGLAFAAPALAAPARASSSIVLPDPSGATLLAIGVAGLVVGRFLAKKKGD